MRERTTAPPAARRKKAGEDGEKGVPPAREKRSSSAPARTRRTEEHGDASPIREKRTAASPAGRPRRTEGRDESKALPGREKRMPPSAGRPKRSEDRGDSTAPIREKRATSPSARDQRTEAGSDRKPDPTRERKAPYARGKKTDAPAGEKDIQFPREARRYINVFLGLGSNVGDRRAKILTAINLISDHIGKVAKKSHLYETQPWGNPDQDSFLNQVIMINTMLDPRGLLQEIADIEQELGRDRRDKDKWGPRTIDIDILFYGKRVVRDKGLEVPHPELHQRAFVLVPLMEIAPDLEHPILKQQIDELYMACEDQSEVIMLDA